VEEEIMSSMYRPRVRILVLIVGLCVGMLGASASWAELCEECHARPEFKIQHKKLFDYYLDYQNSVHGAVGIACVDCHGGDPGTEDLDRAHAGVMQKVRFDRIPDTCGACHEDQYEAFVSSQHYRILSDRGTAPNCVTCHGAMEMDFIFAGRVKTTCQFCHNPQTDTNPNVPSEAEYILNKINIIKGYKSFVALHSGDPDQVNTIEESYARLTGYWHRFDFEQVAVETDQLLEILRTAKAEALRAKRR